MKVNELCEYLSGFDPDETVGVLALNLETRQAYKISGYQLMTDAGCAVLLFEFGQSEPLDDVLEDGENER